MTRWTLDSPTALDFDGVVALRVRIIAGSVAVLATGERPRLEVAEVTGQPLLVSHEAGILTVSYEDLSWDGLLSWLRPRPHSANVTIMVNKDCPVQLGVVGATAVVSGISARTSIKSVSGDITLDGVTSPVDASTVSGSLEARGLAGELAFHSVSGELTVAGGHVGRLEAKTVSGAVTADVALDPAADVSVATLSGEVAIRLPASTGARAELRSASGRLRSDFDRLSGPEGASARKFMTGTLGSGAGRISVSTVSGNVTLLPGKERDEPDDATAPPPGPQHSAATGGPTKEGEAR